MRSSSPACTASNRARTGARLSTGGRPWAAQEVLDRRDGLPRVRDELHVPHRRRPRDRHRRHQLGEPVEVGHLRGVDVQQRRGQCPQRGLGVPLQELLGHGRHDVLRHPRHAPRARRRAAPGRRWAGSSAAGTRPSPRATRASAARRAAARRPPAPPCGTAWCRRARRRPPPGPDGGRRARRPQHPPRCGRPATRPRRPRWSQSAATSAACAGIASRSAAASGPGTSLSPWPARVERDHPVGGRERRADRAQVGPLRDPAVDEHGDRPVAARAGVVVGEPQARPLQVVRHDPPAYC